MFLCFRALLQELMVFSTFYCFTFSCSADEYATSSAAVENKRNTNSCRFTLGLFHCLMHAEFGFFLKLCIHTLDLKSEYFTLFCGVFTEITDYHIFVSTWHIFYLVNYTSEPIHSLFRKDRTVTSRKQDDSEEWRTGNRFLVWFCTLGPNRASAS